MIRGQEKRGNYLQEGKIFFTIPASACSRPVGGTCPAFSYILGSMIQGSSFVHPTFVSEESTKDERRMAIPCLLEGYTRKREKAGSGDALPESTPGEK